MIPTCVAPFGSCLVRLIDGCKAFSRAVFPWLLLWRRDFFGRDLCRMSVMLRITSKGRCKTIARNEGPRINEEITSRTCRLIDADGRQLGLFGVRDALRIAHEQNMDLVEIAPNAEPPVCKVMDYSKYKYEQDRKAKAARKKQVRVEVKEMKFRPKIDVGDYETKKNHVMRFLRKGARVKITIMFRGREMAHPEQGLNVLERLAEDLRPYATVEQQPKLEGRNMHMLVAPIKGAFDDEAAPSGDAGRNKRKGR